MELLSFGQADGWCGPIPCTHWACLVPWTRYIGGQLTMVFFLSGLVSGVAWASKDDSFPAVVYATSDVLR